MKCTIHIYLINDLYSQDFADKNYQGNESADNRKYLWEDELSVNEDVIEADELRNSVYSLQGEMGSGNKFKFDIPGMHIVQIKTKSGQDVLIGASESIAECCEIKKSKDITVSLFIKDNEPYANPVPGIYIASKEFPKELIS